MIIAMEAVIPLKNPVTEISIIAWEMHAKIWNVKHLLNHSTILLKQLDVNHSKKGKQRLACVNRSIYTLWIMKILIKSFWLSFTQNSLFIWWQFLLFLVTNTSFLLRFQIWFTSKIFSYSKENFRMQFTFKRTKSRSTNIRHTFPERHITILFTDSARFITIIMLITTIF